MCTQRGGGPARSRAAPRWGEPEVGTLEYIQDVSPDPTSVPRECRRTQGVSTTDLVGRMLLVTKAHHSGHVSLRGTGAGSPRSRAKDTAGREGAPDPPCPCLSVGSRTASLEALGLTMPGGEASQRPPPFRSGDILRVPGIRRQLRQGECCPYWPGQYLMPPTLPLGEGWQGPSASSLPSEHCWGTAHQARQAGQSPWPLEEDRGRPLSRWPLTRWPGPLSLCSPLT